MCPRGNHARFIWLCSRFRGASAPLVGGAALGSESGGKGGAEGASDPRGVRGGTRGPCPQTADRPSWLHEKLTLTEASYVQYKTFSASQNPEIKYKLPVILFPLITRGTLRATQLPVGLSLEVCAPALFTLITGCTRLLWFYFPPDCIVKFLTLFNII